jgi:hypothetical protein
MALLPKIQVRKHITFRPIPGLPEYLFYERGGIRVCPYCEQRTTMAIYFSPVGYRGSAKDAEDFTCCTKETCIEQFSADRVMEIAGARKSAKLD